MSARGPYKAVAAPNGLNSRHKSRCQHHREKKCCAHYDIVPYLLCGAYTPPALISHWFNLTMFNNGLGEDPLTCTISMVLSIACCFNIRRREDTVHKEIAVDGGQSFYKFIDIHSPTMKTHLTKNLCIRIPPGLSSQEQHWQAAMAGTGAVCCSPVHVWQPRHGAEHVQSRQPARCAGPTFSYPLLQFGSSLSPLAGRSLPGAETQALCPQSGTSGQPAGATPPGTSVSLPVSALLRRLKSAGATPAGTSVSLPVSARSSPCPSQASACQSRASTCPRRTSACPSQALACLSRASACLSRTSACPSRASHRPPSPPPELGVSAPLSANVLPPESGVRLHESGVHGPFYVAPYISCCLSSLLTDSLIVTPWCLQAIRRCAFTRREAAAASMSLSWLPWYPPLPVRHTQGARHTLAKQCSDLR